MSVYGDCRWQWIDDNFGPMGWFTDAERAEHEGADGAFANGHWRAITADERAAADADYIHLAREQN